jgi:hypothetical protein
MCLSVLIVVSKDDARVEVRSIHHNEHQTLCFTTSGIDTMTVVIWKFPGRSEVAGHHVVVW